MKRLLILSLLAVVGVAEAQTHAIGRLFFSPEERAQLERARAAAAAPPPAPAPPPVQAAPPPAPPAPAPPLTVNGYIRRGNGPATVWVNGQSGAGSVGVSGPAQAPKLSITLPSGERVEIKPGQTVDPATGVIEDLP